MRRQPAREPLARPVQPHPDVPFADLQAPADLRGGRVLQHLQPEYLAKAGRQRLDLALQRLAQALASHLREGIEGLAGALAPGAVAAVRLGVALQAHVASLAPEAVLDLVPEDADEPRAQRRTAVEAAEPRHGARHGLLDRVLRQVLVPDPAPREAQHRLPMGPDLREQVGAR